RPWFTRRTFASWASLRGTTGTAAATSSQPPRRPCAASSLRTPGARAGGNVAAVSSAATWTKSKRPQRRKSARTWSPSDEALTRLAAGGLSAQQIAGGIKAIVEELKRQKPSIKILVLGVFPRGSASDAERSLDQITE